MCLGDASRVREGQAENNRRALHAVQNVVKARAAQSCTVSTQARAGSRDKPKAAAKHEQHDAPTAPAPR
eukprot:3658761-Lingulodinium_polyedra.AAC.1